MGWKKNKQEVPLQAVVEIYQPVEADFVWKKEKNGAEVDDIRDGGQKADGQKLSLGKRIWARFAQKSSGMFGLAILFFLCVMAGIGPGMNSYTYAQQDLSRKNLAPRIAFLEKFGIWNGDESIEIAGAVHVVNGYQENGLENVYYWFGSDGFGRDIWTRTWEGTRVSLIIALSAAVMVMVTGTGYGMISGYFGGRIDMVLQRLLEIVHGIPRLVMVTLLLLVLPPGMLTIILALVLTEWVGMSRIARGEVLRIKDREFILASRTLGAGSFRVIFWEILPNCMGPILTQAMLFIPGAIFTEAFLSFIGLGIPVPRCSLGSLISEGFANFTLHPYQMIPPAAVMVWLMLGFYLTADGIREALDPKWEER